MTQTLTTEQFERAVREIAAAVEPWLVEKGILVSSANGSSAVQAEPASWTKVDVW